MAALEYALPHTWRFGHFSWTNVNRFIVFLFFLKYIFLCFQLGRSGICFSSKMYFFKFSYFLKFISSLQIANSSLFLKCDRRTAFISFYIFQIINMANNNTLTLCHFDKIRQFFFVETSSSNEHFWRDTQVAVLHET